MNSIKIGPFDYRIEIVTGLHDSGQKLDGQVRNWETTIHLEKEMGAQCMRQTLWHEALHVLLMQAGIRDHSEQLLEALSHGVMSVLRDNPWMAKP